MHINPLQATRTGLIFQGDVIFKVFSPLPNYFLDLFLRIKIHQDFCTRSLKEFEQCDSDNGTN